MDRVDPFDWYWSMPIVTRLYFTGCCCATLACALDVLTPYDLYFNAHAILQRGQVWRLVTNFLFFGNLGIDFLFHMYFIVRYSRGLEEGRSFAGRPGDFVFCLAFGMALIMAAAPYTSMLFFGQSLSFMLVYLWGKRNPDMQIALLGLVGFTAPYLPWVLLAFSLLLGHDVTSDALGICVGHLFFFAEDVWPALAHSRGWRLTRILPTPSALRELWGYIRGPAVAGAAPPAIILR